jgi:Na+-transporting NADH:ubiquinone oxidoreductase subunit NqrB
VAKRVLIACAPLMAASIYLFGWRVAALLVWVAAFAFATEAAFTRRWKEPVSSAVFVSAVLYTFSLPPTLPFGMAAVGIVFGILFGKMVYGGFGRNIFNFYEQYPADQLSRDVFLSRLFARDQDRAGVGRGRVFRDGRDQRAELAGLRLCAGAARPGVSALHRVHRRDRRLCSVG